MVKSIEEMQQEVVDWCRDKGWYDQQPPITFTESMFLIVSEVAEAFEAWRNWGMDDVTLTFEAGSWEEPPRTPAKPEGVGSEFADIFIRLLDDCARYNIDLRAEYERKMAYNRTRPYRHGDKPI
jgi:NTP pyrophosphatase (non-canonical NTP hydrolase)